MGFFIVAKISLQIKIHLIKLTLLSIESIMLLDKIYWPGVLYNRRKKILTNTDENHGCIYKLAFHAMALNHNYEWPSVKKIKKSKTDAVFCCPI